MRRRAMRSSTQSIAPYESDISDELEDIGRHLASITSISPGVGGAEFGFDLASYWNAALTLALQNILWIFSLVQKGLYLLERAAMGISRWIIGGSRAEADSVPLLVRGEEKRVKRHRRKRESSAPGEEQHFPGMVNLSGVLCYMNSVLQALASVESLVEHLKRIMVLADEVDIPTPVTDALSDVLADLNTPLNRPQRAVRPADLLVALRRQPAIQRLLAVREQQDAHELFVVLAEAVSDEALKVARSLMRLRGLAEVSTLQGYLKERSEKEKLEREHMSMDPPMSARGDQGQEKKLKAKGLAMPWEGLIARRRTCRKCGWCEVVRMDTLGGMELPVPQYGDVSLDACIAEYLAPELLSEVTCEMCSVRATYLHYQDEAAALSASSSNPTKKKPKLPNGHRLHTSSSSGSSFSVLENLPEEKPRMSEERRKKRIKDAEKVVARLRNMIEDAAIVGFGETSIPPSPTSKATSPISIKWQNVNTESVRESFITRPPSTLRLGFIRSGFTPYGQEVKKTARVAFPQILDLTRFVANSVWDERPTTAAALAALKEHRRPPQTILYQLQSVICHYGYTTSSGHFVAIRRKPSIVTEDGSWHPYRAKKTCPDGCRCEDCLFFGQARPSAEQLPVPGQGWLRVSDADIEEVGDEALVDARAQVTMLFYERVKEYKGLRDIIGTEADRRRREMSHDEAEGSQASRVLGDGGVD